MLSLIHSSNPPHMLNNSCNWAPATIESVDVTIVVVYKSVVQRAPDVKIFYYIIIDKIVYNMGQLPCIIWNLLVEK